MPIDYTKYPPNWKEIRAKIMQIAEGLCQCTGECGAAHKVWGLPHARCNAPHDARIIRDPTETARWWPADDAPIHHLLEHERKVIRVCLTIAHLCQDSACADLTHLRAWCQLCHNLYDRDTRQKHAAETRRHRKEAQGQLVLTFGGTP